MAVSGIKAFDEEAKGIIKFPMKPEVIAYNCPEYESPLDVVKITKEKQNFDAMLELCDCGCTKQVHELAQNKCVNIECRAQPCLKFVGTGNFLQRELSSSV